jgi:hypothetical protein
VELKRQLDHERVTSIGERSGYAATERDIYNRIFLPRGAKGRLTDASEITALVASGRLDGEGAKRQLDNLEHREKPETQNFNSAIKSAHKAFVRTDLLGNILDNNQEIMFGRAEEKLNAEFRMLLEKDKDPSYLWDPNDPRSVYGRIGNALKLEAGSIEQARALELNEVYGKSQSTAPKVKDLLNPGAAPKPATKAPGAAKSSGTTGTWEAPVAPPGAASAPAERSVEILRARNKQTGEVIESTDGGKTWRPIK